RIQPQLARREQHQEGLARALEVPQEAFARRPSHNSRDDLVDPLHLLVAGDDLDAVLALPGRVGREAREQVLDYLGPQHGGDGPLSLAKRRARVFTIDAPGPPLLQRDADGAVTEILALGGYG